MTIADLLGNPLPSVLVSAKSMDTVTIAWRRWLGMRVKIIDEYNRIPTRTQSALLTVMADNYAEMLDQIYECPEAAWYLTANDDAGGGTYQIDVHSRGANRGSRASEIDKFLKQKQTVTDGSFSRHSEEYGGLESLVLGCATSIQLQ